MQVNQLIEVVNYINSVIDNYGLNNLYQNLINYLNQARQNPNDGITENIIVTRQSIYDAHKEIEPIRWNFFKRKLFNDFGAQDLLGNSAINSIENIFRQYQADPNGAANGIQNILKETTQLKKRVSQLLDGLGPLADEREYEEIQENEAILQLYFDEEASVETINDLENYSGIWKKIIHSFLRLSKDNVEDAKILSIEQGSLLIEVLGTIGFVAAIAKATTKILEVLKS